MEVAGKVLLLLTHFPSATLPPLQTTPLHTHKASRMSKEWFQENLEAIRDHAFICGLLLRSSSNPNDFTVKNIAVNITPLPFPAELYQLGVEIQPALNLLIDAVSRDHVFLEESLKRLVPIVSFIEACGQFWLWLWVNNGILSIFSSCRVIKLDYFTKKLYDIYSEVRLENQEVC